MQKTLIANRNMTYATRRLKAGDEFVASAKDANVLVRLKRASEVPTALVQSAAAFKVPPPPPKPVAQPAEVAAVTSSETPPVVHQAAATSDRGDALTVARAEYEDVVGKRAFHGWDEQELRRRIAEHQSTADSDGS